MKRIIALLLFWVATTVFPFGWLGSFSSQYADIFNTLFASDLTHFVMHSAIFFGLMVLLALATGVHHTHGSANARTRRLFVLFVIVALIASAQEYFQLLYKERAFGDAERFDIATDMGAALLGLLVMITIDRLSQRRRTSLPNVSNGSSAR